MKWPLIQLFCQQGQCWAHRFQAITFIKKRKKNRFIRFVLSTAEKSFICWGKYYFLPLSPLTCVMIFPLKTAHQREGRDEFLAFSFSAFEILMRLCDACDDCRSRPQSTGLSVNFFNGRGILLTKGGGPRFQCWSASSASVGLREV